MKHALTLLLACALATPAFATWTDVRSGMSVTELVEHCGHPILVSRGKGYETWIYDNGGHAMISNGVLVFFTAPKK